ncbi:MULTISPECIES: RagB/SusD family nutrient uptake outer membrane protein [unclassified Carboxylicivirga]|uniref:RagB/SusD family nutrient uptake outer membrane protein n=1 Tax=Carboxylicivirga TaxID=1628153 RepID=UPI003D33A84F
MNKIKLIYSFCVVILLTAFGCEDSFLDEKMYSQLGPANFYKTEADAIAALNGVYDGFQAENYYGRTMWNLADYPTEMHYSFWSDAFDRYTYEDDENKHLYPFWNIAWKINNRANSVIERVPAISFNNEETKNRIIGEAKFLRALNYFNLVRFFGHIPLITSETTTIDENQFMEQVPRAEVYDQIINDLMYAEENLPVIQEEACRATQGAAKALLGKVYLTMAGYALNYVSGELEKGDNQYYQLAADKLKEVIDLNVYKLEDIYEDVFDVDNPNGKETVFSVQYMAGTGGWEGGEGNSWTPVWVPKGSGIALVEWKSAGTPIEFFNSYPAGDQRRDASFMTSYIDGNGATIEYPTSPLVAPHLRKFLSDIQEGPDPNFSAIDGKDYGCDFPVLRYADVLLMYSEALNELDAANKTMGINDVRVRAGLEPLTTDDQETLRQQILQERKWELTGEGHGWFDYVRLGVLLEPGNSNGDRSGYLYPSERNYLYPIPFTAREINRNLDQNFGW